MHLAMTCSPIHPAWGSKTRDSPLWAEDMRSSRTPGECEVTLAGELQQMVYPRRGSAPDSRKIDPTI
jgi:hypothetical protein